MGTWIEIPHKKYVALSDSVVPYVGTWIEIFYASELSLVNACRSLRGNVDRNIMSYTKDDVFTRSFPTWERG